jgi:DNA gyrase/topoisomerase IV subunit A
MADDLDRSKVQDRLLVLNGVLDALNRLDEISAAIRRSTNRLDARSLLQSEPFGYSSTVVEHILDLNVGRRTAAGIAALEHERDAAVDLLKTLD